MNNKELIIKEYFGSGTGYEISILEDTSAIQVAAQTEVELNKVSNLAVVVTGEIITVTQDNPGAVEEPDFSHIIPIHTYSITSRSINPTADPQPVGYESIVVDIAGLGTKQEIAQELNIAINNAIQFSATYTNDSDPLTPEVVTIVP